MALLPAVQLPEGASGETIHSSLAFIFLVIPLLLYQRFLKIMDSYLPLIS